MTAPIRTSEEKTSNATFDALMWALSRPGSIRRMPVSGEASIIGALIDRECKVFAADPLLLPLVARTGAEIAEQDGADFVFLGSLLDAGKLRQIRQGSDLYPDDGATLVLRVSVGQGTKLWFSGPGVEGAKEIAIGGLPANFWALRSEIMRYPMGFELILVDGPEVVGVPRSTVVEVA